MKDFIDLLYGKIGKKIMALAIILNAILLVGGIVAFIVLMSNKYHGDDWIGVVCLFGGIFSILITWFIYAFGRMVDDLDVIRNHLVEPAAVSDDLPDL